MTEATRQRVLEAIRELGYKTPPLDPRFLGPHTHNIGVLAADLAISPIFSNLYFGRILDSVLGTCLLQGWGVTIMAERMWDDAGRSIRRTYDGRCDGILAIAPESDAMLQPFAERGVPLVQVGTPSQHPEISSVDVDNAKIGRLVAQRFVELGHSRLGFIGSAGSISSRERLEGYRKAAAELGAEVVIREYASDEPGDVYATVIGDAKHLWCTALFCWNDEAALYVARAAARVGLRIPEDLSVVGVDGVLETGCDSYLQPIAEIGRRAVELLLQRIQTGPAPGERILFDVEPIVRGSVGPNATNAKSGG